jgi:hypothetical protein
MTYNDAKLTIESADERLPPATLLPVLQGLVKGIEYLRGYTEVLQGRLEAAEKTALMHYGALTALKQRLDVLEDAVTTPEGGQL